MRSHRKAARSGYDRCLARYSPRSSPTAASLAEAQELLDTLDVSMLTPGERLIRTVHYAQAYVALLAGRPREAISEFEHLKIPREWS
jgi:hypothetical protein